MRSLRPWEWLARPDFYIFEPKSFVEKLKALFQNTYEIQLVVAVIMFAFVDPQLDSLIILLLTMILFNTAVMKPDSKMIWGCVMLFILAGTTFFRLDMKLNGIKHVKKNFSNYTKFEHQINVDGFDGLIPYDKKNTTSGQFTYKIDTFKSIHFELFVTMIFIFGMFHMFKHHERIEEYKNNKMGILMVKNYELSKNQPDEDDDQMSKGLGTKDALRKDKDIKELKKKRHEAYEE